MESPFQQTEKFKELPDRIVTHSCELCGNPVCRLNTNHQKPIWVCMDCSFSGKVRLFFKLPKRIKLSLPRTCKP